MDRVNTPKILVLGASGMLGSMVFSYFIDKKSVELMGTVRNISKLRKFNYNLFQFDVNKDISEQLSELIKIFKPDYVINCIGIINKYCKNNDLEGVKSAIKVNSLFPYELSLFFLNHLPDTRIIHITTDCVFSGKKGNYIEYDNHDSEDYYGKTKSLGEVISKNVLNIRCSIIGPEIENKQGLFEWFFSNTDQSIVPGYAHHLWNGVTTLQFVKFCENIIDNSLFDKFVEYNIPLHYCPNLSISKYDLINLFQKAFQTEYKIIRVYESGTAIDRTLDSSLLTLEKESIEKAISELKLYVEQSDFWLSLKS